MRVLTILAATAALAGAETFTNPINRSADPWMGFVDGQYRLATTQGDCVRLISAPTVEGLKQAKPVLVWGTGKGVWAPEFHRLEGPRGARWYCYFTKTDGPDEGHRMWVTESRTGSIEGPYAEPVMIRTDPKDEYYAIDGTVWVAGDGTRYFLWAGHPGHRIFISKMENPWTLEGERVMIPVSGFGCQEVREGPYLIVHGERVFLTYSACDTGKPDYKVGYVWMKVGADPMDPASWAQEETPLLERHDANGVFGPGHHSFFKSPDGKEDWIAYHGKTTGEYTYRGRTTRIQKLEWDAEGFPKKVEPVKIGTEMHAPGR